jgi:hypothetical protein
MDAARDPQKVLAPITWAGLAATYLLFAGQVSSHEVIAGLGASVAAAAYATVSHRVGAPPLQLRLNWFRLVGGVARALVLDTIKVGFSLMRAAPGSLSGQKLPQCGAGQRAVDILALSAAPNGIVVRAGSYDMLLHRLVEADRSR